MRRVALALFSTVAGLVMLLNFKTHSSTAASAPVISTGPAVAGSDAGSAGGDSGTTPSAGTSTSGASSSAASSSAAAAAPSASAAPSSASSTKTVTGDSVDTRWGPVQVQITVRNGTLTAVNAVVYPENNSRDEQINSYAIPQLNQEAMSAKSANIDMVSGATYTSDGYIQSLQSALDQAGL
jgi:uncharacterized protein with FMN-binding domain